MQSSVLTMEKSSSKTPSGYLPLVNETTHFLSKSKSKYISVGLSIERQFAPVVRLCGGNQCVNFEEEDWIEFQEIFDLLLDYLQLQSPSNKPLPLLLKNISIHFTEVNNVRIIQIINENDHQHVFLARETAAEWRAICEIISNQLNILKRQEFKNFYFDLLRGMRKLSGDLISNVYCVLAPLLQTNSENANCLLFMLHHCPVVVRMDYENLKFL